MQDRSSYFITGLITWSIVGLVFIIPASANAENPATIDPTTPTTEATTSLTIDCTAKQLSGMEQQYCAQLASKSADKNLDKHYQTLIQHIKRRDHRKLLRQAQKAWTTFRESECNLRAAPHNNDTGTGFSTALNQCIADVTNKRITELNELMKSSLTYPNS